MDKVSNNLERMVMIFVKEIQNLTSMEALGR